MTLEGRAPCVDLGVDLRGRTVWTAHAHPSATGTPSWSLQVAWAPDGRHLVWLIGEDAGPGSNGEVHALPGTLAAHVAVRIPPSLRETGGPRAVAALLDAEVGAVLEGMGLEERDQTVIRAATQKDLAEKLAEAIPGRATVQPLVREGNTDIVGEVGASASR